MLKVINKIQLMLPTVAVGLNEGKAKELINGYYQPALIILLFAIPIAAIISSVVIIIKWFALDEDEKEQKKPGRIIKKIVFWAIIGESIVTIFAIFGLAA